MKTLPYTAYEFTLFCDNLFGNPQLFSLLQSLGIGVCSTARRHITKPVFGDIDNQKVMQGTLRSAIIAAFLQAQETILEDGTVLVSLQQDSNKVGFCTTIHDSTEQVVQTRKRPKGTSTSAAITKEPFKMFNPLTGYKELYKHTRDLPIPVAIDNYN